MNMLTNLEGIISEHRDELWRLKKDNVNIRLEEKWWFDSLDDALDLVHDLMKREKVLKKGRG